jgi:uracil-DNA glycosylase family 4
LNDLFITSVGRCAPPANKPTRDELANCSPFLDRELTGLKSVRVVVILGKIAFDSYLAALKRSAVLTTRNGLKFGHGAQYPLPNGQILLCSYHPSLQNTNTGKLTEAMLLDVFRTARRLAQRH